MGSVRLLPQKCRDVAVWAPFGGIFGFPSIHSSCGAVSILCARKSVMVFLRPSRVAHGTHISAVRLQALPRMILCHIARHARHFSKNFFTFFGGYFCDVFLWGRCRGVSVLGNRVNIIIFKKMTCLPCERTAAHARHGTETHGNTRHTRALTCMPCVSKTAFTWN